MLNNLVLSSSFQRIDYGGRLVQTVSLMQSAPSSFPLRPIDASGRLLSVGSNVRVLSVESCCTGLPRDDQEHLRRIVGQTRRITEFDRFGFVWLSFNAELEHDGFVGPPSHPYCPGPGSDFCVFPREVALVQPSGR